MAARNAARQDRSERNASALASGNQGLPSLAAFLDDLAQLLAERVVAHLRATDLPGYIDQSASPLGRRRHIEAIRSGKLRGVRVGRRYLARKEDVDHCMAEMRRECAEARAASAGHDIDALAQELGFRKH
jgi:hypothetical protein